MLITITIALCLSSLILIYLKWIWDKKEMKTKKRVYDFIFSDNFIGLIVGITTTMVGVIMALYLTNYDIHRQEERKTITLLATLDRELKMVEDNINEFYIPLFDSDDFNKCIDVYKACPIQPIFSLDTILGNEIIVTNTNEYSYAALIDGQRSLYSSYERINVIEDSKTLEIEINILDDNIKFMRNIIACEINFQNGKYKSQNMNDYINAVYKKSFEH